MEKKKPIYSYKFLVELAKTEPVHTFNILIKTLELNFSTAQDILENCEGDHRTACEYILEQYKETLQIVGGDSLPESDIPDPILNLQHRMAKASMEAEYLANSKKPPKKKKKNAFATVLGYIFLGFICLVIYGIIKDTIIFPFILKSSSNSFQNPTPLPFPSATHVARTPTPSSSCIHWMKISSQMEGRQVCVYGKVFNYQENYELEASYLYFGNIDQFFLVISGKTFPDMKDGLCVQARGKVEINTYKTPYIKIDALQQCEPWMNNP